MYEPENSIGILEVVGIMEFRSSRNPELWLCEQSSISMFENLDLGIMDISKMESKKMSVGVLMVTGWSGPVSL